MNIPLDNLYHWIRGLVNETVSIYTFRPHGSKNINDLHFLSPQDLNIVAPEIVCHDQEPLNFSVYKTVDIVEFWKNSDLKHLYRPGLTKIIEDLREPCFKLNFYAMLRAKKFETIFDHYILLHSEKNSKDVEHFSKTSAIPAFYWSHAVIARDWYRFAQHDTRLLEKKQKNKMFLVYQRAWTGTREYRLKFSELLLEKELLENCQTSILYQDNGHDLRSYVCSQSQMQPSQLQQLFRLPNNQELSCASADYNADDYMCTDISVVLETVAADTKIHLTEKILRPIACGHPFLLVAGPESLEFLKSYGFKTFSPWINESYDAELDIVKRMELITNEMKRISNLPQEQKNQILSKLTEIASYNKNYFFSNSFSDKVQTELVNNLNSAISQVKKTQGNFYKLARKLHKKHNRLESVENKKIRTVEVAKVLRKLKIDPTTNIKNIILKYPKGFFNS
jgi:hypothetical protein